MEKSINVHGHGTGIRPRHGFSLLEVLLSAAVMSTGLAGLAALLMAALGGTLEASHRGQAMLLAQSMAGSIQITPAGSASFIAPGTGEACPVGTSCTSDQFASFTVSEWHKRISSDLPDGSGLVCRDSTPWDGTAADPSCDGAGPLVVKVFWSDSSAAHAASNRLVEVLP